MAKLTLTDITSGYLTQVAYNDNNVLIEAAIENTLSRDGSSPNTMSADLDLNSKNINNVNSVNTEALQISGVSVVAGSTLTVPTAANVPNVAAGLIVATDVQAALNELDTEKMALAETQTVTGDKTFSGTNTHSGANTFSDVNTFSKELVSTIVTGTPPITVASTTEVANLNVEKHGGLRIKVIDIGDWDMDGTSSVNIAHGLTLADIRSISALIRDDANTLYLDFPVADDGATGVEQISVGSTNVTLLRGLGGTFDSTAHNATSFNRGWVTIWYV